jgi:hypothetical protein
MTVPLRGAIGACARGGCLSDDEPAGRPGVHVRIPAGIAEGAMAGDRLPLRLGASQGSSIDGRGSLVGRWRERVLDGRRLRASWGDLTALRDPRRAAAVLVVGIVGGLMVMLLAAHGHAAGADAWAYWQGARTWLAGGDPYVPTGPWLPYVYAIWLLPLFVPWALLPWPLAWVLWRGSMVLLFVATFVWAYRRRPLATALVFLALSIPIGLVLDSANVALFLVFALWAAQFTGPRTSALLWAVATAMKWIPAAFFPILTPTGRRWGLALMAVAVALTLVTWPQTVEQIGAVSISGVPSAESGIRTLRVDHLVFLWALVPWLWGVRAGRRPAAPNAS